MPKQHSVVKLRERLEYLLLSVPHHLKDLHHLKAVLVVGGCVSVLYVLLQHLEFIRIFLEDLRGGGGGGGGEKESKYNTVRDYNSKLVRDIKYSSVKVNVHQ